MFRNIFRSCFHGKLPVNNGAHEYLNALLLSTCFRLDLDALLSPSFRAAFARGGFAVAGGSPQPEYEIPLCTALLSCSCSQEEANTMKTAIR